MNERDEFEAFWAKLAGNYPCYGDENHRAIAQNAWLAARQWQREQDAKLCEELVERDAEYSGRFGGYGNFKGQRTGAECADAIMEQGK